MSRRTRTKCFTDAEVRAIRDGRKTQFREVIRPSRKSFPYVVGDLIRVRETWSYIGEHVRPAAYLYAADGRNEWLQYYSPARMPAAASRYTIEVVNVRCQQVQDIAEDDAIAEGLSTRDTGANGVQYLDGSPGGWWRDPRRAFSVLWDRRNRKPGDSCVGHVLGTGLFGGIGSIALGMPKGFNRPGPADEPGDQHMARPRARNTMMIRLHISPADAPTKWDRFNIPVWALVLDGALFVRTYMPRVNATAVDVIHGGTLDMVPDAIDVGEFYDEID